MYTDCVGQTLDSLKQAIRQGKAGSRLTLVMRGLQNETISGVTKIGCKLVDRMWSEGKDQPGFMSIGKKRDRVGTCSTYHGNTGCCV